MIKSILTCIVFLFVPLTIQGEILDIEQDFTITAAPGVNFPCLVRQIMTVVAYDQRSKRPVEETLDMWKSRWDNKFKLSLRPASNVEIQRTIREAYRKDKFGEYVKPVDGNSIPVYVTSERILCKLIGY